MRKATKHNCLKQPTTAYMATDSNKDTEAPLPEGAMRVAVSFAKDSTAGSSWMRVAPDASNTLICASWEFVKVGDCVDVGGKPAMGLRSVMHTIDPCVVAGAFLPSIQRQGWGTVLFRPEMLSREFAEAAGLDVYNAPPTEGAPAGHNVLCFDP